MNKNNENKQETYREYSDRIFAELFSRADKRKSIELYYEGQIIDSQKNFLKEQDYMSFKDPILEQEELEEQKKQED